MADARRTIGRVLAGPREAVLNALGDALEAALGAGARELDVQLQAPTESRG